MQIRFVLVSSCVGILCACAPQADLDKASTEIAKLQAENAQLKMDVIKLTSDLAKKPALPVTVSFRKAYASAGYVAILNTTVKTPLSVLLIRESAELGTTDRFELHLDPETQTELGGLDGIVFQQGDSVTLQNLNYSPSQIKVVAQP
ncbi:MAG: hypothetical protein EON58_05645 [Alphaproteobacteria bacterium]|nr:MAG: hypothetical protein EON58_05645 [Alphaproteobacteria bacterium]